MQRPLGACAVLAVAAALVLALTAPPDAVQGDWQRLMYVHVPAAWTGFAAFALVLASSVAYLRTGRGRWDAAALAAAEVGTAATAVALVSGSVWGHVVWGVWWTWDARLVSTALLLLLYVAYLGVRGLGGEVRDVRRLAAWVGIVSFADVPVVHFSVLWWRTLHQPPTILAPRASTPPIDPRMLVALLAAVLAATLVAAWVLVRRLHGLLAVEDRQRAVEGPAPAGAAEQVAVVEQRVPGGAAEEAHELEPVARR